MAIKLKQLWGHTERPWGYEIRADFQDGANLYHEVFHWKMQPKQADIDAKVAEAIARLTRMVYPPTKTITAQDGAKLSVLQSDCQDDVSWAIALTGAQNTALGSMHDRLITYLPQVMEVYRKLPPEKQAELRAHNSVLNRVLEMIGE